MRFFHTSMLLSVFMMAFVAYAPFTVAGRIAALMVACFALFGFFIMIKKKVCIGQAFGIERKEEGPFGYYLELLGSLIFCAFYLYMSFA